MAGRRLEALTLTDAERSELTVLASRPKTAQALAQRARIILACAEGHENKTVSSELGVHAMTVGKWRRRFLFPAGRWTARRTSTRCASDS
jgi:FixJ family two-component response regulator